MKILVYKTIEFLYSTNVYTYYFYSLIKICIITFYDKRTNLNNKIIQCYDPKCMYNIKPYDFHSLDCKKGGLVTAHHNKLQHGVTDLDGKALTPSHMPPHLHMLSREEAKG